MKNLKYLGGIGLMALALCLPSCDKEDNTDELLSGLNGLEKRVAALEALQGQVDAIQAILDAAANNYLITSVVENKEGEVVTGYTITFSNGETITIQNGKDGEAGITPEISVAEEGGNLYWKVNGQWLMNGENKVPAEGIAPQFKIEDNVWKVSYDGVNFVEVPGSPNPGGTKITCTEQDDSYIIKIGDKECVIAKYQPLNITFTSGLEVASDDKSAVVDYEITDDAAGVSDYIIMAFANSGYTVTIDKADMKITVDGGGLPIAGQEITILVSDGGQRTIMRSFKFVGDGSSTTGGTTVTLPDELVSSPLSVAAAGETKTITVSSDFAATEITPTISYTAGTEDWVSIAGSSQITRAMNQYNLVLTITKNTDASEREATVTLSAGENVSATFKIVQDGAEAVDETTLEITIPDGATTLQTVMENAYPEDCSKIKTLIIKGNYAFTTTDQTYLNGLFEKNGTFANVEELDISNTETENIGYNEIVSGFVNAQFKRIKLPNNLLRIANNAFQGAVNLVEIEIPSSVVLIATWSFSGCTSLRSVVFKGSKTNFYDKGGDVPTLAKAVFNGCTSLQSIKIESVLSGGTLPSVGSLDLTSSGGATFKGVPEGCTLYVPADDVSKYKADANGWAKAFPGERIQAIQ